MAHGSPIGLLDSATTSMVFAVRSDYIQTDAPINSSKFCGPLPNPATRWGITTYDDLDGDGSGLGVRISMPARCRA